MTIITDTKRVSDDVIYITEQCGNLELQCDKLVSYVIDAAQKSYTDAAALRSGFSQVSRPDGMTVASIHYQKDRQGEP